MSVSYARTQQPPLDVLLRIFPLSTDVKICLRAGDIVSLLRGKTGQQVRASKLSRAAAANRQEAPKVL